MHFDRTTHTDVNCERAEMSDFVNSVTAAQINLSDDAPWKKIQKNTFTRWCNEHLRCMGKQINDLRFDLSDGLNLISLLEVLSHKRMFRKFHVRPTLRQLKLDNVSVALEFLDHEKIKLVSIDSKAIVDGNLKLILGLVWTLILHYSISIPVWEDEASETVTKLTPEMKLLGWIQSKVPELPITNFSQDWQDGRALGALVDGLAPGLCPDWESWETVQRVTNTREAMQQADDWLGVPQLIAPEEILDPGVDERSVMTYLSLFPKAKLKPGAPLKPKTVPKPKACRATGRGLQGRGLRVGQLADFKVDTHMAGPGNLAVYICEPTGNEVAVKPKLVQDGVYGFEYMPCDEGDYTVNITWANKHIPKSPFKVHVGPKAGQQKIRAWGPGLEGGTVGIAASFLIEATGAEAGMLGFAIEGPSQAKIECDDQNDGSCFVRFWTTEAGEYAVHVMCDDEEIEDSPFMACIGPKRKGFRPDKVKVYGAGVSPAEVLVNCQTEFTVDATMAGEGVLKIFVQTVDGGCIKVDVICEEAGIYNCSYTPTNICKHTIVVSWGGVSVPGSPFMVMPGKIKIEPCIASWNGPHGSELYYSDEEMDTKQVTEGNMKAERGSRLDINVVSPLDLPTDATKVRAYGPGLQGGLLGQRAEFTVDTRGAGSGRLTITIEGPFQVTLQCMDNEDGTCAVFYLPAEHGEYTIRIFFADSQIPGSPFLPVVHLPLDPSKVTVSGPGLTKGKVGEPCMVNIDCALAGLGDLSVEAVSDSGVIAKTEVRENEDGSYTVVYVPLTAGVYTLLLKYGGKVVPNFPAEIVVDPAVYKSHVRLTGHEDLVNAGGNCDPSQIIAGGLGLLQGLTGHPNKFYINTRGAANGNLEVTMEGPSESLVSCRDNEDGSYTVEYIPSAAGQYDVNIAYGGKSIPGSSFKVTVKDVSDTNAEISGPEICTQSSQNFLFDCNKTGKIPETVTAITPEGKTEQMDLKDNGDGTYTVNYSPSVEGPHSLIVKYAGDDSYASPFNFQVLQNPAGKVKKDPRSEMNTSGEDFESGICTKIPQSFTIGCSATQKTPETIANAKSDGADEVLELTGNGNRTPEVTCSPTTDGSHLLSVKHTDDEAFSSPFESLVADAKYPLKSIVTAPGLVSGICTQTPQDFTIDCREHGQLPTSVAMMNPKGLTELLGIKDNSDGTYTVNYSPSVEGSHSLMVKYGDGTSFSSPFKFQVFPSFAQDCMSKRKIKEPDLDGKYCAETPQTFMIGCSSTGEAPETVAVMKPDGSVDLGEVTDNGDGTYSVFYCPSSDGPHSLVVKYADEEAFSSAFEFHTLPADNMSKVNISAPGIKSGICTQSPQTFRIDCSKTGKVPQSLVVITPKGVTEMLEVESNGDETYTVSYFPTTAGPHSLMVRYAEDDSYCSPFSLQALPTPDSLEDEMSRKVNISGHDLAGIHAGVPQTLIIGCSDKGEAPEMVALVKPDGTFDLVKVTDNADGTYSVHFPPLVEGRNSLFVKYANEEAFGRSKSFEVLPTKPSKLKLYGTGMKSGICSQSPQTFTIDCSTTGQTLKTVAVLTPNGETELVEVKDNEDGTYTVKYSPSVEGPHSIMVKYAEDESFSRPLEFQVLPVLETTDQNIPVPFLKMSGQDLMGAVYQHIPQTFTVGCTNTGETPETAVVVKPDGTIDLLEVHDNLDGTYSAAYAPSMAGSYSFVLRYSKEESFCRPIGFQVLPTEETKVKVTSPGLESGIRVQQPQTFTIDCSLTGVPDTVAVICPNGTSKMLQGTDNGDGTYSVSFYPSMEGPHGLVVKTAGEDKSRSPLGFQVLPAKAVKEVIVSGPGLDSGICSQSPQTFMIDCSKTGDTPQIVSILTPYGLIEQLEVKNNGNDTYTVNYSPSVDGVHSLMVKYATDYSYCRFHVLPSTNAGKHCDLLEQLKNRAGISGPGWESGICTSTPQTFTINCSSTGSAPETVAVVKPDGTIKLVDISGNGDGTYSVACSPSVEGSYFLMVKYTDEDTFRSPCEFQAIPSDGKEEPQIYGLSLDSGICAQVPQTFKIDSSETGKLPESVVMITPNGKTELVDFTSNGDGTYTVNYSPSVEGPHSLMVKYKDDQSFSSSLKFHVLPTSKQIRGSEELRDAEEGSEQKLNTTVHPEMPQMFTLKSSSTGTAPQTAAVVKPDGTIDLLKVLDNGDGTYHVTYAPSKEGTHSLVVRYAGEEAFCSPTEFNVLPQHNLTSEKALDSKVLGTAVTPLSLTNKGRLMTFDMVMQLGLREGEISGEVIMPSGMISQLDITENSDGTITLRFNPTEEGLHHILIKSCVADIPDLSLQYYVNSGMSRNLKAHGRGLVYGVTHEPAAFTISHEDTAIGELDITVEGASETEVHCFDNKDGTCTVTYLPTQPGDYSIQVRHNDMHISGSPFKAKITDGSLRKSPQVTLGTTVDFALDITEEDISLLTASISSPTRQDVPCALKRQPDSHIGISFIPREVGEHLVSIKKDGKHVGSSPIPVCISMSDIGDASKVKVFGLGLHNGCTNHMSEFVVNTWDAGYGGLTVAIEGPGNVVIHTEELENGACRISYCPSKPGNYKVSIRFSDEHIPGSPFLAEVTDGELMRESITHYQKPPTPASIGEECCLTFKISGTDMETMSAIVSPPSGTATEAVVTASNKNTCAVSFVPEEIGVHSVSLKSHGQEIEGSPLQYTVGRLGEGGAAKVQTWGQGLNRAYAKIPADFNIWAREAGEGNLCVSVEGPGHTELHLDDHKDGSCSVSYTVEEPGYYEVSILFNEEHISASPFLVSASALTDNTENSPEGPIRHKATDHELMSNSSVESLLPGSGLNSLCTRGAESVLLSNVSKITSHGPGLTEAIIGQKNTFYVDCSKAGRNMLFVGMLGPTVPCERVTVKHLGKNQYAINYTVKETGQYILAVKWGEEHIPGSPFHISVS